MIDAAGPWGTGPFTLTEGSSAIYDYSIAFISADPFAATWLGPRQQRTERVVLEANERHWNTQRGPRLQKVIYRNDLSPADALAAVCNREGEVDILSEVSPADAQRVIESGHAKLVAIDAMRVLVAAISRRHVGAEVEPRVHQDVPRKGQLLLHQRPFPPGVLLLRRLEQLDVDAQRLAVRRLEPSADAGQRRRGG